MRYLVYVVPIGLAIYALIDLSQSRPQERAGLRPWLWAVVVVLVPVLGPVAWIATSRYLRSQQTPSAAPQRPGRARGVPRRRGPVAPDDDPDFLWRIERERRRREAGAGAPDDAAPGEHLDGPAADDRSDRPAPDPDDPRA
ncbi:PLDc N-terminal domain-containing protein [Cellulomonas carbonis]|uniref:Cardiolipin synthase N-terminal domain-containing protein n=1 Tax=Cellulomonas carbonis T26 TaxID=947969 RepID=A0A0A0BTS8_9CELL|nr:PLDc N-terminal domain-containing protein [Cellulomonas carbonis]KGM11793.1 hypothetical protein N868_06720 [Cellulomonas carbonis T26]GGC09209.1 hypothetical protein GCM10010972_23150 [Cellulomonas carbonis]